jgi:phosphatidylglycerophosphate synthase
LGIGRRKSGGATLRVWIDATRFDDAIRVFGMTLLERLLRSLLKFREELAEVRVALSPEAPTPTSIPAKLTQDLPLHWCREDAPLARRLRQAHAEAGGEPTLVFSADTVVDERVVVHLLGTGGALAFIDGDGEERSAVLRLEGELPEAGDRDLDLPALAELLLRSGKAQGLEASGFDGYIVNLRRMLPPYLFRIPDAASRDRVERFLFRSNYKGSTDFLTKYVYPPLVWAMVRPLTHLRIHPNWVTGLSWVAAFVAVPLFAAGAWLSSITLAYVMSVLDSVDGKVARLTFTSSKFGEIFDHGLDIIHPPIWYMAWGWALSQGDPTAAPFQASLLMFGVYVADRACAGVFRGRTGASIHGYTPLDEKLRTFISRRNVNLAFFTAALLIDWLVPGHRVAEMTFYAIVAWQIICLAWHIERVVQFWNSRRTP